MDAAGASPYPYCISEQALEAGVFLLQFFEAFGFCSFHQLGPARACRDCCRSLRRRPAALAVALDAEVASLLDVVALAPALRLERELVHLATSRHLAHVEEWAGRMAA